MDDIWFSPSSIRFTREQVIWLLAHLQSISEGYWPTEHEEGGYVYMGGSRRSGRHRGYFETPVAIGAELKVRMERCETDGLALDYYLSSDTTDKLDLQLKLARYLDTTQKRINRRLGWALGYCCGWHRKQVSYHRYCVHRRSYEKRRAKR